MPDMDTPAKRGRKTEQAATGTPIPQEERIANLPLSELHDFPNHPFKVRDDEAMQETAESIKQYGVLVPAIVRPREDGGYEIVAGHRRKRGSELAELMTMPCIVRDTDADTATILIPLRHRGDIRQLLVADCGKYVRRHPCKAPRAPVCLQYPNEWRKIV